jgi:hypothetical protein
VLDHQNADRHKCCCPHQHNAAATRQQQDWASQAEYALIYREFEARAQKSEGPVKCKDKG